MDKYPIVVSVTVHGELDGHIAEVTTEVKRGEMAQHEDILKAIAISKQALEDAGYTVPSNYQEHMELMALYYFGQRVCIPTDIQFCYEDHELPEVPLEDEYDDE